MFKKRTLTIVLLVCLLIVLTVTAGNTVAYIVRTAAPIPNTFVPASVSCQVEETFANNVKENVSVRNTGNISAYIRAAVVINWVDEQTGKILSNPPGGNTHYAIEWADIRWVQGTDGFWYYPYSVASGDKTPNLIRSVTVLGEIPEGVRLSVQILASAIQANPADVVATQWNVTVSNGVIDPK